MTINNSNYLKRLPFIIPLLLMLTSIFIIQFSTLIEYKTVALAVTLDLIIFIPLVYYLLIRKTSIRKTSFIPLVILGMFLGSILMPETSQEYLNIFKIYFLPLFEITIFTLIIIKTYIAFKKYKQSKINDFISFLKKSCIDLFPEKIANLVSTEIAVFYYGFFKWHSEALKQNEFSYHKNSGLISVLYTFLFIICVETFLIHILVNQWSSDIAWILTGLSIYTLIQIFGIAKSLELRPIYFDKENLYIRSGILGEVNIPFYEIESLKILNENIKVNSYIKSLSPFNNVEKSNIILVVKNEQTLLGLYGINKKFYNLIFHIDEPEKFIREINNILKKNCNDK